MYIFFFFKQKTAYEIKECDWSSDVCSSDLLWLLTEQAFFVSWLSSFSSEQSLRFIFVKNGTPEVYLPWQMVLYLAGGLIGGIVVSLFTRPVAKEKLDNFYALVRTPVTPGEQVSAPCTLPDNAVIPEKRSIFPNTNLEIQIPSRISVIGFLIGWGCVAAIIYLFYLIMKM